MKTMTLRERKIQRKTKKSSNPAIAFFQAPAAEQKKAWKQIIRNANKMQRDTMSLTQVQEINKNNI